MSSTRSVATQILAEEVKEIICEGKSVTLTARGSSMNPALRDRKDKIILSPFNVEDLSRGDVIFTKATDGEYIIHRIVGKKDNYLRLLGDGNLKFEELAAPSETIGLLTSIIRNGKEYSCNSIGWRAYSRLWMALLPVRPYLFAIWRRIIKK